MIVQLFLINLNEMINLARIGVFTFHTNYMISNIHVVMALKSVVLIERAFYY